MGALAGLTPEEARTALASSGIGADLAGPPASTLSPGEPRGPSSSWSRAARHRPALDEPTTSTSARSRSSRRLEGWSGTLVVATHDRRLRDALRIEL